MTDLDWIATRYVLLALSEIFAVITGSLFSLFSYPEVVEIETIFRFAICLP